MKFLERSIQISLVQDQIILAFRGNGLMSSTSHYIVYPKSQINSWNFFLQLSLFAFLPSIMYRSVTCPGQRRRVGVKKSIHQNQSICNHMELFMIHVNATLMGNVVGDRWWDRMIGLEVGTKGFLLESAPKRRQNLQNCFMAGDKISNKEFGITKNSKYH